MAPKKGSTEQLRLVTSYCILTLQWIELHGWMEGGRVGWVDNYSKIHQILCTLTALKLRLIDSMSVIINQR